MRHELVVAAEEAGQRLDRFLAGRLDEHSRSRLKALVEAGRLLHEGSVVDDVSRRVKPGERFVLSIPAEPPRRIEAEDGVLDIVFEDEHLIVLVKAAGQVVHPAPGHDGGTLVNALMAHCGTALSDVGGPERRGIVHRLDKDVSGLLVVAKHDRAHLGLAGQFTVHSVERAYDALVWGVPSPAAGRIDRPIGRHPRDRKRMAVVEGGKRAVTRYALIEAAAPLAARVRCTLETGRTHQIRVHMTGLGHPILGDPVYKARRRPRMPEALKAGLDGLGRIALHATTLGFDHPVTGERLRFDSPPPERFAELLALAASAPAARG